MSAKEAQAPVYENTNGVPLCNGKNLHMDVGLGDIANRIITVGSESRAEKIAASFGKVKQKSPMYLLGFK